MGDPTDDGLFFKSIEDVRTWLRTICYCPSVNADGSSICLVCQFRRDRLTPEQQEAALGELANGGADQADKLGNAIRELEATRNAVDGILTLVKRIVADLEPAAVPKKSRHRRKRA